VVNALREDGVRVLSSRLDGQTLTVNVDDAADVAAVRATGAQATVDAPVEKAPIRSMNKQADLLGGTAYYFDGPTAGSGYRCSVGFNGVNTTSRASQYVTAGHCVPPTGHPASVINQAFPNDTGTLGVTFSDAVPGSFQFGGTTASTEFDSGLQAVRPGAVTPQPKVATWGGGSQAPGAGTPLPILGDIQGTVGSVVCKSGSTTGWRCGTILAVDQVVNVSGASVNLVLTSACSLEGDSGGAAVVGSLALGITSAGTAASGATDCQSDDVSGIFPMRSATGSDIVDQHPGWEMAASVPPAVVSLLGGSVVSGAPFTGTVPGGTPQETVAVYFDGASAPSATTAPTGANLAWSVPQNLAIGNHTYRVVVRWGTQSVSTATTGSFSVVSSTTPRGAGNLDSATGTWGGVRLTGWAVDFATTAPTQIWVAVDGQGAAYPAGNPTNWINTYFPGSGTSHGFDVTVPASPGSHRIDVYGVYSGHNVLIKSQTVTVPRGTGSFDAMTPVPGGYQITGWSADYTSPAQSYVWVNVDGSGGAYRTNKALSWLPNLLPGIGQNNGFDLFIPARKGAHQVCVYGVGGSRLLNCKTATVAQSDAAALDGVEAVSGGIRVHGWAVDLTQRGVPSYVWIDVNGAGQPAKAGLPVSWFNGLYPGAGIYHGYDVTIPRARGTYSVCVQTSTGYTQLGCRSVTVR
jgi:hypothetical protein